MDYDTIEINLVGDILIQSNNRDIMTEKNSVKAVNGKLYVYDWLAQGDIQYSTREIKHSKSHPRLKLDKNPDL